MAGFLQFSKIIEYWIDGTVTRRPAPSSMGALAFNGYQWGSIAGVLLSDRLQASSQYESTWDALVYLDFFYPIFSQIEYYISS